MDAKADYIVGSATVSYDPGKVTPSQMVEAINERSFFRASLPTGKDISSETANKSSRILLPLVAVGILVLLGGTVIWGVINRRSLPIESQPL